MSYGFDFQGADLIIAKLKKVSEQIENDLESMEKKVEQSLTTWTGAAQQQYHQSKVVWHQEAKRMPVLLAAAHKALMEIHDRYYETEVQSASQWSK